MPNYRLAISGPASILAAIGQERTVASSEQQTFKWLFHPESCRTPISYSSATAVIAEPRNVGRQCTSHRSFSRRCPAMTAYPFRLQLIPS